MRRYNVPYMRRTREPWPQVYHIVSHWVNTCRTHQVWPRVYHVGSICVVKSIFIEFHVHVWFHTSNRCDHGYYFWDFIHDLHTVHQISQSITPRPLDQTLSQSTQAIETLSPLLCLPYESSSAWSLSNLRTLSNTLFCLLEFETNLWLYLQVPKWVKWSLKWTQVI